MFSEAHVGGVLFAPIVVYCVLGAVVFVPARYALGRLRILRWVWHPALFELSLYICITAAIIFFVN